MNSKLFGYKHTKLLCYSGYVVQAIVNNFVPLLFVFFHTRYNISLIRITFIVSFNFALQLCVDLASALFVDRIGYKRSVMLSNFLCAAGLILLTILPEITPDPFIGILISVSVYAVGGGLLEVIINPIIQSCPARDKEAAMSILHSFYSWGCVAVILFSTLFFGYIGIVHWKIITILWTIIPIVNMLLFPFVPISDIAGKTDKSMKLGALAKSKGFLLMLMMMLGAGASEMTVSQWVSAFAETGLHVSKTVGDIAGTMFFALLFGLSRTIYGKLGGRLDLIRTMRVSALICTASYFLIALSPSPVLALIGCGICGFSVGIFWPGTVSITAAEFARGGTLVFSLLAFAGDIGCTLGPTLAGAVASAAGDSLNIGIGATAVFPIIMLICLAIIGRTKTVEK
ncbi:MAG: MFS transporter [Clostridia bacterium]|nr:MFS transporter [Clostridia bacterium]